MANSADHSDCTFLTVRGRELNPYIDSLGELRIKVFRDWPYLYEGDLTYEQSYLERYSNAQNSMATLVFHGSQLVGATTAIDLKEESPEFQDPFRNTHFEIAGGVYFGESILLSPYRGFGFGKLFMQNRIDFAKRLTEKSWVTFCSVLRPEDHPLKPQSYRPLDEFWKSWGFVKAEGIRARYSWKDLKQTEESIKELQYWYRKL